MTILSTISQFGAEQCSDSGFTRSTARRTDAGARIRVTNVVDRRNAAALVGETSNDQGVPAGRATATQ